MMSDFIDNPFAVKTNRKPARILPAIKGLVLVAMLFVVLLVAQTQSRRWLLERWVTGLAELPVAQQVERLLQIDALGDIAIQTIAGRLAAEDDTVASTAYELLKQRQNDWSSRDDASMGVAHQSMIAGIEAVASELSAERSRWAIDLIKQSLVECADRKVRSVDEAFVAANRVLAVLSPPSATGGPETMVAASPARDIDVTPSMASPQPVGDAESAFAQTPQLVPLPVRVRNVESGSGETELVPVANNTAPIQAVAATPRITPVSFEPTAAASKSPAQPEVNAAWQVDSQAAALSKPITASPYETFDTKSIVMLLGSSQAEVRDQAVDELVKRGLNNEEIRLANQLASPMADVRLGLLESISHRTDVDPRPWLLWLAEDSHREVRMRAISILATMNDRSVKDSLQKRLQREDDPTVLAHLRRVVR